MEQNQEIKLELETWLKDLEQISSDYDNKIENVEKEIVNLKVKLRLVSNLIFRLEQTKNITDGYLFTQKENLSKKIKDKEQELENLEVTEWKNIFQVRELINIVQREIEKL